MTTTGNDYSTLREKVCSANRELSLNSLVIQTWGNASAIDRSNNVVAIKPSGVKYDELVPSDIVLINAGSGEPITESKRPSTDLPTHLEIYREFPNVGGIVHVHSTYAVAWAQAGREIPCYGTTHADYFCGPIPITRDLRDNEVAESYELNTGKLIVEHFRDSSLCSAKVPGILVAHHGPFAWGKDVKEAVYNAVVLEEISKMAYLSININDCLSKLPDYVLRKHYSRKHGSERYYGQ